MAVLAKDTTYRGEWKPVVRIDRVEEVVDLADLSEPLQHQGDRSVRVTSLRVAVLARARRLQSESMMRP